MEDKYKVEITHKLINENGKITDDHLIVRFLKKCHYSSTSDYYSTEASFIISTNEIKPFLETLTKAVDEKLNEVKNYGSQNIN